MMMMMLMIKINSTKWLENGQKSEVAKTVVYCPFQCVANWNANALKSQIYLVWC